MQIKEIILYSNSLNEPPHRISFPGSVNIITGIPNTGKTAIIPIIEYCLGQSEFNVPGDEIRQAVAWYAVLYQLHETQIFIAKPKPGSHSMRQSNVYYKEGKNLTIPSLSELKPNDYDESVKKKLLRLLQPFSHSSKFDESAKITIDNMKYYLFQNESTIANNEVLFHRQQKEFSNIQESLPYMLGILDEEYAQLEQDLKDGQDTLKRLKKQLHEREQNIQKRQHEGKTLFEEAKQAGLIEVNVPTDSYETRIPMFKSIVQRHNQQEILEASLLPPLQDDRVPQLEREIDELKQRYNELGNEIGKRKVYAQDAEHYSDAANEHIARLESIYVFEQVDWIGETAPNVCPLCQSQLDNPTPPIPAIQKALQNLQENLNITTSREKPKLQHIIQKLKIEQQQIIQQLRPKQESLKRLVEEQQKKTPLPQKMKETENQANRVVHRIEYYLEAEGSSFDDSDWLKQQVKEQERRIEECQERQKGSSEKRLRNSVLHEINRRMNQWAKDFDLQDGDQQYQFDMDELTVNLGKGTHIMSMEQTGGRNNALRCHLLLYLALHNYFLEEQRPVPHFLILDQPAQGYFLDVQQYKDAMDKRQDTDSILVQKMFDFLFKVCEQLSPNFQLIILEHANLSDRRFQDALVKDCPWTRTDNRALIPAHWIRTTQAIQQPEPQQLILGKMD